MCVTQQSVSTLLTIVGLRKALDGGEGRLDPRPGPLAFQAFDQARLLAADIGSGSAMEMNIEVEARAENILARAGRRRSIPGSRVQHPVAATVFVADVEVRRLRPVAWQAIAIPSRSWCGSCSMRMRLLNVPGSLSSALTHR